MHTENYLPRCSGHDLKVCVWGRWVDFYYIETVWPKASPLDWWFVPGPRFSKVKMNLNKRGTLKFILIMLLPMRVFYNHDKIAGTIS